MKLLLATKNERYNAAVGSGNPAAEAVSPNPPAAAADCRTRAFFCPPTLPAKAFASRFTTKPPKARRIAQARFGMVLVLLFGVTNWGEPRGIGSRRESGKGGGGRRGFHRAEGKGTGKGTGKGERKGKGKRDGTKIAIKA